MSDREEILDEGQKRLVRALLRARHLHDQFKAAVLDVERIRREVQASTGVSLIEPAPSSVAFDAEFEAQLKAALFPREVI